MPIFDVGYRHWKGRLSPLWRRWWPITRTGAALAYESKAVKRIIFLAWMPTLWFSVLFFAVAALTEPKTEEEKDRGSWMEHRVREFVGRDITESFVERPEQYRLLIWSYAFERLLRYTQIVAVALLIAIVGPGLIANDLRNKSYLVYFAKPITLGEYLLGKAGVVLGYVSLLTLLPALALYLISICFSPSMAVIAQTMTIPLKIFLSFLVIAIPSTALILFFSSMTRDGRIASFMWIMVWVMGALGVEMLRDLPGARRESWPILLSPWHNMTTVIHHIFDFSGIMAQMGLLTGRHSPVRELLTQTDPWAPSLAVLSIVTVVCLAGAYRRVRAPLMI